MISANGPASDVVIRHQPSNDGARIGTDRSSTDTWVNPASTNSVSSCDASLSENGPGMPGGGTGCPSCSPSTSNTSPSQGLRSRAAHVATATRPPGLTTRRDLVDGVRRVESELQAVTAVDDVERGVGLGNVLDVEASTVDVVEPAAVGSALGDIGHLDRDVRRDHLAGVDQGRDGQRDRTGSARELEHPVARSQASSPREAVR